MNLEFKYSKHYDLVLHALTHMKVNNASDLYDENYIEKMNQVRQNKNILMRIGTLSEYYHNHFERLMLIGFLPYFCSDYENMKKCFLTFDRFAAEDLAYFIKPFIQILDDESKFFFDYWDGVHQCNEDLRNDVEHKFAAELQKYSCVFEHYNKPVMTIFSYNITRNGRGIDNNTHFSALIPFPENDGSFLFSFFQALHEYTHQFTDALLNANINMQDGSHDLSEKVVILADYYLIKALDNGRLNAYFEWLSMYGTPVNEVNFFDIYGVEGRLDFTLRNTVDSILLRI